MNKEEEKNGKAEKVVGEAGETFRKGVKKGFGVVKAARNGVREVVTEKKKDEKSQRNTRSTSSTAGTDGSNSRPSRSQKASAETCKPSSETRLFSQRSPQASNPCQRLSTLKPQVHQLCSASSHEPSQSREIGFTVYHQDFL